MFEKEAEEYFNDKCGAYFESTKAEIKEDVYNAFKDGAEFGYNKFKECAKTIIQDLLSNSDEYARQRAMDFLKETE